MKFQFQILNWTPHRWVIIVWLDYYFTHFFHSNHHIENYWNIFRSDFPHFSLNAEFTSFCYISLLFIVVALVVLAVHSCSLLFPAVDSCSLFLLLPTSYRFLCIQLPCSLLFAVAQFFFCLLNPSLFSPPR